MTTESVCKQDAKIDRIMEMIDYIEKDGTLKRMKWHIVPYSENDDYFTLVVNSPKLLKDYYCAASLQKESVYGDKKKFKLEIDCALMSIKDGFEHPEDLNL